MENKNNYFFAVFLHLMTGHTPQQMQQLAAQQQQQQLAVQQQQQAALRQQARASIEMHGTIAIVILCIYGYVPW